MTPQPLNRPCGVDVRREQFEEVMRSVWWGDSFHAERHPKAPDEYLKAPEQMAWIGWQAAMCSLAAGKPASDPIYHCSHCKFPNHAGTDHADCESAAELTADLAAVEGRP